jgi:serine/threonine protein kinase, bacterial
MGISLLGKLLDRRYLIVSALASGGFGKTYIAQDTRRPGQPKCVVKHLQPATSDLRFLEQARRLFATEADSLETLGNHDQIPRLLAYFEEDEEFFLVQELIEGQTLSHELQPEQPWSESQVCQMLLEILNILVFVHGNSVIHRDIKPDNIIRRLSDRQLVLVDFGTVKQIRSQVALQGQSTTTISIGTPGYMPTEQTHGRPRPNSDIYALGIIGIQSLTGLPPHQIPDDPHTGELIWQPQAQVSRELADILAQMVRYHFKDRYQSAIETLRDLAPLVAQSYPPIARSSASDLPPDLPPDLLSNIPLPTPEQPISIPPQPTIVSPQPSDQKGAVPPILEPQSTVFSPPTPHDSPIATQVSYLQSPPPTAVTSDISEPEPEDKRENRSVQSVSLIIKDELSSDVPLPEPAKVAHTRLLIGAGGLIAIVGMIAGAVYWSQRQAYLVAKREVGQVIILRDAKRDEECIQKARSISNHYVDLQKQVQDLVGNCLLSRAEAFAKAEKFQEAIAQVTQIRSPMSDYPQAQKFINQWSEKILQTATNQYRQGKMAEAKAIAQAIPSGTPLAQKAQQSIQKWQTEEKKNEDLLNNAKQALKKKQWQLALDTVAKLRVISQPISQNDPYWKAKVKDIVTQAESGIKTEQAARDAAAQRDAAARNRQLSDDSSTDYVPPFSDNTGSPNYYPSQDYNPPSQNYDPPPQAVSPPRSQPSGGFIRERR